MKIKYVLIALLLLLMTLSIAEIFPIAPRGAAWYPWYSSEYFTEMDQQYATVRDAFLSMKLSGKNDLPWIFLGEFESRSDIKISIYNADGQKVIRPKESEEGNDADVFRITQSSKPEAVSRVRNGRYYRALPIKLEKKCRICHTNAPDNGLAGVMTFERPFNEMLYFTAERRIFFSIIALLIAIGICALFVWDPDKKVKDFLNK
jgi:hypothetical protein